MTQIRDTTRVIFRQHVAWLAETESEQYQRCRLPECSTVLEQDPLGRRKQFCKNVHQREFTKRRVRLDGAIDEVIEMLDDADWSWAERRVIDARLRWLLDVRAEYTSSREQLAITIEDIEPIGAGRARPGVRLIHGWLKRPQPEGPACRRCDGTGLDDRLERLERKPRNSRLAKNDALDRLKDALRRSWRASPEAIAFEPWVQPLEDYIERQEQSMRRRVYPS